MKLLLAFALLLGPAFGMTRGNHTQVTSTAGVSATSSSVNMSSQTFLIVECLNRSSTTSACPAPSDSSSNTWAALTLYGPTAASRAIKIYYVCNPTVSSSQTVTIPTNSESLVTYVFVGYTGVGGGSGCFVSGTDSGVDSGGGFTCAPGSVTPSATGDLLFTGDTEGLTTTIDVGFSTFESTYVADLSAASTSAVNPTWSHTAQNNTPCNIAIFKPVTATAKPRPRAVVF